ncbi:hypothetical protein Q1695_015143 [Nippostrongylus brasiliensis]|nr:hypothetical protein Q1695_015143 [Nippostrongylus brasiliensis]
MSETEPTTTDRHENAGRQEWPTDASQTRRRACAHEQSRLAAFAASSARAAAAFCRVRKSWAVTADVKRPFGHLLNSLQLRSLENRSLIRFAAHANFYC